MRYNDIVSGIFLRRPNRFIAHVLVNGKEEIAHVKNTGRCKELLIPGVTVYLQQHNDPKRKTQLSLIAVQKAELLINMDSQAPNKLMLEALSQGLHLPGIKGNRLTKIQPESVYGSSRFDFYLTAGKQEAYIEVKGVTLEKDRVAMFPDAPTKRGVKHVRELIDASSKGFLAYIIFVIQMKGVLYVTPNDETHREFGEALREAHRAGVNILAYDCQITPDTLQIDKAVPVIL